MPRDETKKKTSKSIKAKQIVIKKKAKTSRNIKRRT
jgi:hypothetical protein